LQLRFIQAGSRQPLLLWEGRKEEVAPGLYNKNSGSQLLEESTQGNAIHLDFDWFGRGFKNYNPAFMKRHLVIASVALLLSAAVPIAGVWLVRRPLPALDGRQSISGLGSEVSVSFDAHAVPYIVSRSDEDAYLAQGFATARDRMFQMDILRRSALGELSEIYGASCLPSDRMMRTLGIGKLAYAEYNHLTEPAKAALDAYARGVNEYLNVNSGNLPLQFAFLSYTPHTWHPEDSLAILKYRAYKLDESWRLDDFRQRVANKVGDDVASQLFRDDLVSYGLPPAADQLSSDKQSKKPNAEAEHKKSPDSRSSKQSNTNAIDSPHGSRVSELFSERRHPGGFSGTVMPAGSRRSDGDPLGFNQRADALLANLALQGDISHQHMGLSPLLGSSTWAVPAGASATSGALLACNTDGPLMSPSDWYICSLNSPGLHVAGASLPGVPGILMGRNEDIGWGTSALKADVQDIFLEQFKSQFDTSYKTADGWKQAAVETELISSRFGKDVEHKVLATEHGPVLLRNNNFAVSLAWTGFDTQKPSFEALYKLNRANSIDQSVAAVSAFSDPPTMFIFADRWGNTACHAAGNVPVRADGGAGTQLSPGWQTKGSWQAVIPFDKLPESLVTFKTGGDSPKDPIIAANQQPATTGDALPQGDKAIMLGHQWAPPYRANRLLSTLSESKTAISLADMVALAGDQYTELTTILSPALKDAVRETHLADRNARYAVELLSRWDGQMRSDTAEAAIYESFIQTLGRRLVEPKIGRELATEYMQRWPLWLTFAQSAVQNKPDLWLPPEERTYNNFFITTLTQSLKSLHIACNTSNPTEWLWGKIHLAVFDPLSGASDTWFAPFYQVGPIAVGGSAECINSCDVAHDPAALNYKATTGPTQRLVLDMRDHEQLYQCINSGQSGQLTSEYRKDQLKSWAGADYFPIAFSSEQLMKQERHRLILTNEPL
jgi:penicillin G amidase